MNIPALITELKTDPLSRGYSAMTDEQVFNSLYIKNRTKLIPIRSADLLAWSAANGRFSKVQTGTTVNLANTTLTHQCRSICWAAIKMLERDNTELDLSIPDRMTLLTSLVSFSILSQDDINNLVALATVPISRMEEIGCHGIIFEHFSYIRNTNK